MKNFIEQNKIQSIKFFLLSFLCLSVCICCEQHKIIKEKRVWNILDYSLTEKGIFEDSFNSSRILDPLNRFTIDKKSVLLSIQNYNNTYNINDSLALFDQSSKEFLLKDTFGIEQIIKSKDDTIYRISFWRGTYNPDVNSMASYFSLKHGFLAFLYPKRIYCLNYKIIEGKLKPDTIYLSHYSRMILSQPWLFKNINLQ